MGYLRADERRGRRRFVISHPSQKTRRMGHPIICSWIHFAVCCFGVRAYSAFFDFFGRTLRLTRGGT